MPEVQSPVHETVVADSFPLPPMPKTPPHVVTDPVQLAALQKQAMRLLARAQTRARGATPRAKVSIKIRKGSGVTYTPELAVVLMRMAADFGMKKIMHGTGRSVTFYAA